MTTEERIEKESSCYAQGYSVNGFRLRMAGYVAGAKAERNKAIDDCKNILKNQTVDCSRVITVEDLLYQMESLKTSSSPAESKREEK